MSVFVLSYECLGHGEKHVMQSVPAQSLLSLHSPCTVPAEFLQSLQSLHCLCSPCTILVIPVQSLQSLHSPYTVPTVTTQPLHRPYTIPAQFQQTSPHSNTV